MNGWEKVCKIVSDAQEKNFDALCGIIDKDCHELLDDGIEATDRLFFTDESDIEMMLFFSSAYDKLLMAYQLEDKLKQSGDTRSMVLRAAKPLGKLRLISLKNDYHLNFNEFECGSKWLGPFKKQKTVQREISPDIEKMVERVISRSSSKPNMSNPELCEQIRQEESIYYNGHDVLDILAYAVKVVTNNSNERTKGWTSGDMIEPILLTGYPSEEFQKTKLYSSIIAWVNHLG